MNKNPFVLPGLGQGGPLGQNPILASMEMMRQAWEGLAGSGGLDASTMERMMSIEEMDKRISDLRAVENWLRMNLSMLNSTIQGLEVQRATIATLKSFAETGMAMGQAAAKQPTGRPAAASGAKPDATATEAAGSQGRSDAEATQSQAASGTSGGKAPGKETGAGAGASSAQSDIVGAAATAAQGWWNMLQQQFQTLAAATAASAGGAAPAGAAGKSGAKSASSSAAGAAKKTATKRAAKAAKAAKRAARTTSSKTAR